MVKLGKRKLRTFKKILPSTNHVLLAGVASLYVYTLIEGDKLPYFLFRCLVAVLVLAWLWSARIFSGIKYTTSMEGERSQVGQIVPLQVSLTNTQKIYVPWLEVAVDIPEEFQLVYGKRGQVLSLAGREKRTFTYQIKCLKRGYFQIGSAGIRLGDVFGIFVRERLLKAHRTLIVYPRIIPLENINIPSLRNLGSRAALKRSDEDLTGPTGVRKYAYGDPLNRVHWRATARTGQLQVKEYDLHTAPEVGIFLDLSVWSYRYESEQVLETAVTTAASIANYCFAKRLRYGLVSNGASLFIQPASRDVSQLLRTMEHLALADIGGGYPLNRTMLLESRNFIQGTTLLLITPKVNEEIIGTLSVLQQRGYSLAVIQIGDDKPENTFTCPCLYYKGITEENLAKILGGETGGRRFSPSVS